MASIRPFIERLKRFLEREGFADAEQVAREVLSLEPTNAVAMRGLATALRGQGREDESLTAIRAAAAAHPNDAIIVAELGSALAKRREHQEAFHYLERAARLDPNLPGVYLNLGAILDEEGHHEEALQVTRKVLRLDPTDALAHYNMGNSLRELARLDAAAQHYQAAVRYKPDYIRASYNQALCRLLLGEYRDGWPGYDLRYKVGEVVVDNYPQPLWDGSSLDEKAIVVHAEQGIGDEVLFASCVGDLTGRAKRLGLVCDPRLGPLFARSFPQATIIPFQRLSTRAPAPLDAEYDYQIPAGSLPRYTRPDLECFPRRRSFLVPDAGKVAKWRERFAALGCGLKIGLSWRAGGKAVERRKRSMPLEDWRLILGAPGAHFVNLQYGDAIEELTDFHTRFGVRVHDWEDADPLVDMDDFAAKIAALDLVISVGNATVHLAGALGVAAWTILPLIPSWRWLIAGEENPWYSSVRLFRQEQRGSWHRVIHRVAGALRERVGATLQFPAAPPQAEVDASEIAKPEVTQLGATATDSGSTPIPEPRHWLSRGDLLGHDVLEYVKQRTERAAVLCHEEQYFEAEELLREALVVAPRMSRAHKILGMVAWKTARPELAISSFRRAAAGASDDHRVHYYLAAVLAQADRFDEAIEHYRRATSLISDFRPAQLELGLALQRTCRHADALAPFRAAQALDPGDFDAYLHEGRSLMRLARVDAARRLFTRAVELEPQCAAAWAELGANLAIDGDFRLAESCLRRARAIDARDPAHIDSLAQTLIAQGREAEAIELFRRAVEAIPEDADLLRQAAGAQRCWGALDVCESLLGRAIALRPADASLRHALGESLVEQYRLPAALAAFDQALAIAPPRPATRRARSLVSLGLGQQMGAAWRDLAACETESSRGAGATSADIPSWDGSPLDGKTIWIRAPREVTDHLLFATTFDELIAEAGHATIECDARLAPLFARAFPAATVAPLSPCEQLLGKRPPVGVDVQSTALGLMAQLRGDRARFIRRQPRFSPEPGRFGRMRRRLAALPPGPRVGLFWDASRPASGQTLALWRWAMALLDGTDSAVAGEPQLIDLAPARLPDVATLLPGAAVDDAPRRRGPLGADGSVGALRTLGEVSGRSDWSDWENIAALVAGLDLLIAEDGPLWALAALMGVRVWALCSAKPHAARWLVDAEGHSLWRRNVRIIRLCRPVDLGDLGNAAGEKSSSSLATAVDLSDMGRPTGPHWPIVSTFQPAR